jgi:amino acid transporter
MYETSVIDDDTLEGKGLKKKAVGFWHDVFQAESHVAPAADVALLITGTAAIAFGATPLVILLTWVGYFVLLNTNYQFSKYLSSSAGYYGFAANSLGKKWGILTGWLFMGDELLAYPAFGFLGAASLIYLLSPDISSIPYLWILLILPYMIFVFLFEYRGIKVSLNYALIAGIIEVSFLMVTSIILIVMAGSSNTLNTFTLKFTDGSIAPIFLGFIIGITTLSGSGSVVALGEESKNPKKFIPRSMVWVMLLNLSIIMITYALTVSWGASNMASFATSPDPGIIVFHQKLGFIVAMIFVAIIYNSYLMFGLAINNSVSRTMYAMARDGILPKWLHATHKKYKSPHRILMLITVAGFAFAIINGIFFGPFDGGVYPFVMIGIMLLLVHLINNVGLGMFIKKHHHHFSILYHLVIPVIASALIIVAIYYTVIPFPGFPYGVYAVVAAIWVVLGIVYTEIRAKKVGDIATVNIDKDKI